ncbi:MarR family winged helix-turn-helix transcriptional regulator [Halotalea alkalilenta]|uniref:MarR family winged helix-turn-helix transcriptional regulator n=1 Tax=Halotalea alkalilenta TaxID=376489 RepID=UPI0006945B03|nr:MarR family transcriptional regulator [Halotalea alkalilenta]
MPSSPDLISLARALDLLHGLAMHQVFPHLAGTLHGGDLSFSQFNALYQLHHDGPLTIAELAKATDLSHNAASRMVEGLVSAGFAERREDPRDRRQKQVELTPAGTQRLDDMRVFTIQTYARLLSPVPAPVLEQLASALSALGPHLPKHPMLSDLAAAPDGDEPGASERRAKSTTE